jgi:cell shape-determining protein MreC
MYAVKGNKEYKIDEVEKNAYLSNGYSIYSDELELVEAPGDSVSEVEKLKAENKKLKAENTKLKNKLKGTQGQSEDNQESEGQ